MSLLMPNVCLCFRWFTNPTTVNAFYSSSTNQISKIYIHYILFFLITQLSPYQTDQSTNSGISIFVSKHKIEKP